MGSFAQKDPKAKEILDKVSAKYEAYNAFRVEFSYVINNLRKNYKDTIPGTFFLKGDKYKLFFMDNEVFYDGDKLVTMMIDANEATITTPPKNSDAIINPAELFAVYKKDFKYSYRDKMSDNTFHVIDLYPENAGEKKYSRIRIKIRRNDNALESINKFDKSGKRYILVVDKLNPDVTLNNQLFTFDKQKYPGVEIIDLRQ